MIYLYKLNGTVYKFYNCAIKNKAQLDNTLKFQAIKKLKK